MPSPAPAPARPLRSLFRNNLLGLIALAVIAPGSYALAADSGSTEAKTTRVCIITKTGMLRYVASPGHCRAGEKSFFVSRRGVQGLRGVRGAAGINGTNGADGATGTNGTNGADGVPGPQGAPGAGTTAIFAEYYARADNGGFIQAGTDMMFPEDGPNLGTITRADAATFTLGAIGIYRVTLGASTDQFAEVQLMLDGVAVPYAAFGGWDASISGETFITTTTVNASLTVRNTGQDLILTPVGIGASPLAARLIIEQMS